MTCPGYNVKKWKSNITFLVIMKCNMLELQYKKKLECNLYKILLVPQLILLNNWVEQY